jgi:hypothetical protein
MYFQGQANPKLVRITKGKNLKRVGRLFELCPTSCGAIPGRTTIGIRILGSGCHI